MAKVIDQAFSNSWGFYNGDCVYVMAGLPDNSIDMSVYSPPFAQLYIYSDHVADMGNVSDDKEFFEAYQYTLRALYRITKMGGYQAIHCKDLMRYMSSHSYAGQYDFPGDIIRYAEKEGWTFQRWVTVWKNPVVEMQRTKTYGLLHKSFQERAEVVRQGAPDYVLVLRKQLHRGEYDESQELSKLPEQVIERCKHIWSMPDEQVLVVRGRLEAPPHFDDKSNGTRKKEKSALSVLSLPLASYTPVFIDSLAQNTKPGRLCLIHCETLSRSSKGGFTGKFDMMGEVIQRFEAQGDWKFHTRIALTDGTYLVGFRLWNKELRANYSELNGQVTHNLQAPIVSRYDYQNNDGNYMTFDRNGVDHPDYVGNDPPRNWQDDSYYSILAWQKYASPVWFDLEGLPETNEDSWMDIDQTNVLNFKAARDAEDEKHICPLQLDLTEKLILEYSKPGDVVFSPYGGIGSEGVVAIKLGRKAILAELKASYWKQGVKYLKESEKQNLQISLLEFA